MRLVERLQKARYIAPTCALRADKYSLYLDGRNFGLELHLSIPAWPAIGSAIFPTLQVTVDIVTSVSCATVKEFEMNLKLTIAVSVASLFAAVGTAYAQDIPESTQQKAQQKAEAPPPVPSSDDATYGGVLSGRSMSASGTRQARCSTGPNCDIFFGQ
jgi:hypothetical protein